MARAVLGYLRLHKPSTRALSQRRAARLVAGVLELIACGEVTRNGVTRPAPPTVWVQAMDQMLEGRERLRLPLSGHGYLLEVAFGHADKIDAQAEKAREERMRSGRRADSAAPAAQETPLQRKLAWLRQQLNYGALSQEQFEAEVATARAKFEN
ncbi:MAG: hypothetical protein U0973_11625 [Xanthomonadaceae bacterium]|nr:hypothetical protein [Xanthomonadaceae bacterium]